jgi:hypothetical protein
MEPIRVFRATVALAFLFALAAAPAAAHPLITEPAAPLGKLIFESGFAASYRHDTFRAPKTEYETVTLPFEAKLGLTDRLEAGIVMNFLSHRLTTPDARFKGSRSAVFNPEVKYSPIDNVGVQFIYHHAICEEGTQELPIARGDDYEVKGLFHLPVSIPMEFNVGYLFRNDYFSTLGINNGPKYRVNPADIFEMSLSAEFPLRWNLALLTEGAYYAVGKQRVAGVIQTKSNGTAADALVGITWTHAGWSLGTGIAFGLLDESHTSFDLERGAGDYQLRGMASYRLKPRKPGQ